MTYLRTILIAILLAAIPATVQAQMACAPREIIVQAMKEAYGESQIGIGLMNSKTILELWVSKTTGSWTIIRTNPEGWTCVITSGISWRSITPDTTAAPTTTAVL